MTTLKDIRERWAKATPGPWNQDGVTIFTENESITDGYSHVASAPDHCATANNYDDLTAIANAPTDVAYLLDLVERAKPWIGRHVVTLTINRMEAIQIRELLDEMESAKGGE